MGCAKIHSLYLITRWNRWLNRWWKWVEHFLGVIFPKPCRAPWQSGERAALPKGHLKHLQSAFYLTNIKIDLFYCVLKISAPDLSLFLHWQKDASIALPRAGLWQMGGGRSGSGVVWKIRQLNVPAKLGRGRRIANVFFTLKWYLTEWAPHKVQCFHSLSSPWAATSPLGAQEALTAKFCSYWCTARRRWCEFCSQGNTGFTRKRGWVVLLVREVKRAASVHFTAKPH